MNAQTGPTTYYVDATGGNDDNNGTSPSSAWQTIFKVNNSEFNPGDSVLFKRGETWRELLMVPSSGNADSDITFGTYGTGDKPLLLGSVERNDTGDWYDEGNNIWSTVDSKDGNELLNNPSFDENVNGWTFYSGNGAAATLSRDTEIYDSAPAGIRIDCESNEQENSTICLYTGDYSITGGEWYIVSFRARGSSPFNIFLPPNLSKNDWSEQYLFIRTNLHNYPVTTEWATYNFYYLASATASDAVVFLDLGTIPGGESLYLDSLSFQKCDKTPLSADVGSLIFNGEESVGTKVNYIEDLDTQGEFWFDALTGRLKMYSSGNPASYYSDIECAQGSTDRHIMVIRDKSYVTVENLHFRYCGGHGIRIEENPHHITIRDCDLSYIGGSFQYDTVRFGNGIEIWEDVHDCTVEGCRIWEIYDDGITNQGQNTGHQYNLFYRNNLIWNCEHSFIIFFHPESSRLTDMYIEGNVCIGAGFGWSHKQRPDHQGWHLPFFWSTGRTENIVVQNNVLYEAAFSAVYLDNPEAWTGLKIDYNYYYQKTGETFAFKFDKKYTMDEFAKYQSEKGYDLHSVAGDKEIVKEAARAITRAEDVTLLNELFIKTDELEATKNEGITHLDGAEYAPEPETTEPEPEIIEPEAPEPETYEPKTPEPETYEPDTSANKQSDFPMGIPIAVASGLIVAGVVAIIIIVRNKKR